MLKKRSAKICVAIIAIIVLLGIWPQHAVNAVNFLTRGVYVQVHGNGTASCFHEAHVSDNNMHYRCTISIKNCTAEPKYLRLYAVSVWDYLAGHIQSVKMDSVISDAADIVICVEPYDLYTVDPICFVSECGTERETLKCDRSLPLILVGKAG